MLKKEQKNKERKTKQKAAEHLEFILNRNETIIS